MTILRAEEITQFAPHAGGAGVAMPNTGSMSNLLQFGCDPESVDLSSAPLGMGLVVRVEFPRGEPVH